MERHQQAYEVIAAKEDNLSDSDEELALIAMTSFFKRGNTPPSMTQAEARAKYHKKAREEREENGQATCDDLSTLEKCRRVNGYNTPEAKAERRQHIDTDLGRAQADGFRRGIKYYLGKINVERVRVVDEKVKAQSTHEALANDLANTSERCHLAIDRVIQTNHEHLANNNSFVQADSHRHLTDTSFIPVAPPVADRRRLTNNGMSHCDPEHLNDNAFTLPDSERHRTDTNSVRYGQAESERLGTQLNILRSKQAAAERRHLTPDKFAVPTNHSLHSRNALRADFERRARLAEADSECRRTEPSFPRQDLGHGTATVAGSHLTASVSGNNLSQPTAKPDRSRSSVLKPENESLRLSRIPSPVVEGVFPTRRYASAPVLPRQQVKKEVSEQL